MRIARSSIFRTAVLIVAVPIVSQLAMLALLLSMQAKAAEADAWLLHSQRVLSEIASLRDLFDGAHSAERAVALLRAADFERGQRDALLKDAGPRIAALRPLVSDNPGQQKQLDTLDAAAAAYLQWFRATDRLPYGDHWTAMRAEFETLGGKRRLDVFDAALETFATEEQRLNNVRVSQAAASRIAERRTLLAAVAVSILSAAAILIIFSRTISGRLARVSRNAKRIATGGPLPPLLKGDDDIADLDAALHDSATRLRQAAEVERRSAAALQQRSDALERANRELAFRTQENEMFVYSVSHDLRSPLVNLQGFTKELTHECNDVRDTVASCDLPAATRAHLHRIFADEIPTSIGFIQTAVSRLGAIVDALLRLSRAGRIEYVSEAVDLSATVDRILRAMQVTLTETAVGVQVGPLPAVQGDPTAIEQLFANLITNAVNYLDRQRPGRIEIGSLPAADRAGMVSVYVRDNGLGIPDAYLNKLFVPFERLHGNHAKGEGIGLALVKRIADRHRGDIRVESVEGAGTTFYVTLPAAQAAAHAAAIEAPHSGVAASLSSGTP